MVRKFLPALLLGGGLCIGAHAQDVGEAARVDVGPLAAEAPGLVTADLSSLVPTPAAAWEQAAFHPAAFPLGLWTPDVQAPAVSLAQVPARGPIEMHVAVRAGGRKLKARPGRFPIVLHAVRVLASSLGGRKTEEQPGVNASDLGSLSEAFFDAKGGFVPAVEIPAVEAPARDARLDALKGKSLVVVGYAVGPHHLDYLRELHSHGVKIQLVFIRDSQEAVDVMERMPPADFVDRVIEVRIPAKRREGYDAWHRRIANLAVRAAEEQGVARDGVLSFVEENIDIAAMMAARWGLPHMPAQAVRMLRDKASFVTLLRRQHLPAVPTRRLRGEADVARAARDIGFPGILKPAIGASAYGAVKIEDAAGLSLQRRLVRDKVVRESRVEKSGVRYNATFDPRRGLAYQKLLKGPEIDIDFVRKHGRLEYGAVTDNHPVREGSFAPTGLNMPSGLPQYVQEHAIDLANALAEAAGADDGIFHFEAIASNEDGEVYLIDANPRLGGRPVFPLHRDVMGVNLVLEAAMIALDIPGSLYRGPIKHPAVYGTVVLPPHSGILRAVEGWEDLVRDPLVWPGGTFLLSAPGSHVEVSALQMNRAYAMRAVGNTLDEARRNHAALTARYKLKVVVDPEPAPAAR